MAVHGVGGRGRGRREHSFETLKFDERNADFILLLWYMFKELIATRPKYPDDAN